jgi:hypothetical protein
MSQSVITANVVGWYYVRLKTHKHQRKPNKNDMRTDNVCIALVLMDLLIFSGSYV